MAAMITIIARTNTERRGGDWRRILSGAEDPERMSSRLSHPDLCRRIETIDITRIFKRFFDELHNTENRSHSFRVERSGQSVLYFGSKMVIGSSITVDSLD